MARAGLPLAVSFGCLKSQAGNSPLFYHRPVSRVNTFRPRARTALRRDNARLCARKLWGLRKLGAQKREKTSRPRPAVGAVPPHAQQEDEQMKNLGVLQAVEARAVSLLLLEVLDHFDQLGVQALRKSRVGRLFVVDA